MFLTPTDNVLANKHSDCDCWKEDPGQPASLYGNKKVHQHQSGVTSE